MTQSLSWEVVPVEKPDELNVVIGQAHFIKTVDDLHEALAGVSPTLRFGVAFCEASGPRLVRRSGNDPELVGLATRNAQAIGAGHSFVILLRDGFPLNVLNPVRAVPEVCGIFCATANPVDVVVAVTGRGRGIVGVIDGEPPWAWRPSPTSPTAASCCGPSATSSRSAGTTADTRPRGAGQPGTGRSRWWRARAVAGKDGRSPSPPPEPGAPMTNLATNLVSTATSTPEHAALRVNGQGVTYQQLHGLAAKVAGTLRADGVEPGDRVAVILPNVPAFPVVYWGILLAGGIVVPMNPLLKAGEIDYFFTDSGAKFAFVWPDFVAEATKGAERSGTRIVECGPMGPTTSPVATRSRSRPSGPTTTRRSSSTPRAPPAARRVPS